MSLYKRSGLKLRLSDIAFTLEDIEYRTISDFTKYYYPTDIIKPNYPKFDARFE